ncbi:MAG: alanine--tRNA ligase [Candidatus Moranbacteria bacterium]|nr:alanine--tRNA ligase [Candidatus Moranbacteria bacterium]
MHTNDIRTAYLKYFSAKGHKIVPSALLVPENDPTTLFTGSGMQPMLPFFLGEKHPLGTRVADSQKCFRSGDIEEVGDNRHTTFFEMLGNWSFGDYFKQEQIAWMWEFLTGELHIDPKRLYFTCFRGNESLGVSKDIESAELWQKLFASVKVDAKIVDFPERDGMQGGRIFYYDETKNWWSRVGTPGNMPEGEPGGPDTEMFFDFYPELGDACVPDTPHTGKFCHVNCDCGRFMEIGNNVFMQYRKTQQGFEELKQKNVDFGGGLERLWAAANNSPDVFYMDAFQHAKEELEKISGKKYGEEEKETFAMRVILDHIRAATFLIGDNVLPSNKDQGYFVRRLIRRSIRFGKELAISENFVGAVAQGFVEYYKTTYSVLGEKQTFVYKALVEEEEKFRKTLDKGLKELEGRIEKRNVTGKDAFELFSTYGFPLEMTEEIAKEKGIVIERGEFKAEFAKHQELSRTASAGKFKGGLADHSEKTTMLHTTTHLMLAGLRKYLGQDVHQAGSNITEERTRFDFTHQEKVSREILDKVEAYVNEVIAKKCSMTTEVMEKNTAKEAGVEGSFWEKYPDKVTVYTVKADDGTVYSQELCGGPHVANTGNIQGTFRIIKEEASSAGVRRIKAILE